MLVQGVLCSAIVLIVSSIVLSLSGSRIRLRRRSVSEPAPHRPSQAMAYFVLSGTVIFSVLYFEYLFHALERTRIGWFAIGLLAFKTSVEVSASFYGFAFLFGSIFYLVMKEKPGKTGTALLNRPAVGVIYLCCDDVDIEALDSLANLRYDGALYLIIHDDSKSGSSRSEVDDAAEHLRPQKPWKVIVLRRPVKRGGKPGALNYVLEQSAHLYEYFFLCDNDSTLQDGLTIERAMPYFQDERVAIVQCRSVAVDSHEYSPMNRLLSRSINAFHVYFSVQSKFGWQPFIGHNAFLRTRAVQEVGGFTPGFFADDLDLTVRLNLKGYSVAYAPEIRVGEKHPPSYTSFRRRSYKWAYGCMQTLKAHAMSVLTSRRFSLAEKLSFFQFAGFYVGQTILLLYLAVTFMIAPVLLKGVHYSPWRPGTGPKKNYPDRHLGADPVRSHRMALGKNSYALQPGESARRFCPVERTS